MNDAIRRLIELERRQLNTARAQIDIRNQLVKSSQDTHNHWYNTYPAEPRDPSTAPGASYPWAMKRVWVTLDWDTSVVFDPYTGHKAPSIGYDAYAWPSGQRILCDWSNASPQVPYNGAQWFGAVATEARYGYKSSPTSSEDAVKFSAMWDTSTQTFSLYLTNFGWVRPHRTIRYYHDSYWRSQDKTTPVSPWIFDFESVLTVPYNAAAPQFIGNGSLSATATMRVLFTKGAATDYWSSDVDSFGSTYPLAPIYPAVPNERYALYPGDPDPSYANPDPTYLETTSCNVTVEWEN